MKHTSLQLSKKLNDAGVKGESEMYWENIEKTDFILTTKEALLEIVPNGEGWTYLEEGSYRGNVIPAYDILNDLCCRFAKELFGEGDICEPHKKDFGGEHDDCQEPKWEYRTRKILSLLQQGKKEEAEKYLWENCVFNK